MSASPTASPTLRASAILLTTWSVLNALVAIFVIGVTAAHGNPPALALLLDAATIHATDPRVLGVVNAQAMLVNPLIVAICALTTVLAWRGVRRGERWAVATLAAVLGPMVVFAFVSDAYLGSANVAANVVSSAMVLVGIGLGAVGSRQSSHPRS